MAAAVAVSRIAQHKNPTNGCEKDRVPQADEWLIVSPYIETQHQLNLNSLDAQTRLMALALHLLSTARSDYAICSYAEAFYWNKVMEQLRLSSKRENLVWKRQEFYVVEFKSQLKESIDVELLYQLDKESHAEATQAGGLLKYWYGSPDIDRRNLATCVWRNKEDAVIGGRGPWHKQARAVISKMYEQISIRGMRLIVDDDVSGWRFE